MKKSKRVKVIVLLLSTSVALSLAGCTNSLDSNSQTVYSHIDDENQIDNSIVNENTKDSTRSTDSIEDTTESENDPIAGPPAGAYRRLE